MRTGIIFQKTEKVLSFVNLLFPELFFDYLNFRKCKKSLEPIWIKT